MTDQSDVIIVFTEIDDTDASIGIVGDLDLRAEADLLAVLARLWAVPRGAVTVELGELGFVGAALPNFLVRLRHTLAPGATLSVRRPSPMARRVLELTDLPRIAQLSGDVCAPSEDPSPSGARPRQRVASRGTLAGPVTTA